MEQEDLDSERESHCDGGWRSYVPFISSKKKKDKKQEKIPVSESIHNTEPTMDIDISDSQECSIKDASCLVKKGLCVLICNGEFAIEPKRPGIWWDARLGTEVFEKLGFTVLSYFNKTGVELMDALGKVAKGEEYGCKLDEIDCLVIIISTHGAEVEVKSDNKKFLGFEHVISTKDGIVETDRIVRCFDTCRPLKGKPKLFFIQACRGRMTDTKNNLDFVDQGVEIQVDIKRKEIQERKDFFSEELRSLEDTSHVMPETFKEENREFFEHTLPAPQPEDIVEVVTTPCYTDCLLMFASPSGKSAWSDSYGENSYKPLGKQGGWLLMCLYNILMPKIQRGETFEILEAVTEVMHNMAQEYQTTGKRDLRLNELVSVPCLYHMLRKEVYFKPT